MSDRLPSVRVFIHDARGSVRGSLRKLIEEIRGVGVVDEAESPTDVQAAEEGARPHMVMVDVRTIEDGIAMCRDALARHPGIQCFVLVAFADDEALDALLLAAAGYLHTRPRPPLLSPALVPPAAQVQPYPHLGELFDLLSTQEQEVAALIAEGLTNREIASRLHLAEKTVRNYTSNLLKKLRARNRTHVVGMLTGLARQPEIEPGGP